LANRPVARWQGWLLAHGVNHGITLENEPALQYLYYIDQIPLALTPLSNDTLFKKLRHSPIPKFHRIGLITCIGTDDPLQFHTTHNPLLEEYAIAAKAFRLTPMDKSEMATYSIKASCFEHRWKEQWLGKTYWHGDPYVANNPLKSNLGDIRPHYRSEALQREMRYVLKHGNWLAADGSAVPLVTSVCNRVIMIQLQPCTEVLTDDQIDDDEEAMRTLSSLRAMSGALPRHDANPFLD
jgi:hypothetical protein